MFVVFVALYQVVDGVGAIPVSITASLSVMPLSFVLNRRCVFGSRGKVVPELGRFAVVYIAATGAGVAILAILLRVLPTPVIVTQAAAIVVLGASTFLSHSLWTFARRGGHRPDRTPTS